MYEYVDGSSALADAACWNIWKTRSEESVAEFALHASEAEDAASPAVLAHVIAGLLDHMRVAVRAEGSPCSVGALTALEDIWKDGRMLKRAQGAAFVAVTDGLETGELLEGIEPCVGADAAFCFKGFSAHVGADQAFRSLMDSDNLGQAQIELTCPDFASGDLYIRLDAAQMDECDMLGVVRGAVSHCGRYLQMEM